MYLSHVIVGYEDDNDNCFLVFLTHTSYILLKLTGDNIVRDGISSFEATTILTIKKSWNPKHKDV